MKRCGNAAQNCVRIIWSVNCPTPELYWNGENTGDLIVASTVSPPGVNRSGTPLYCATAPVESRSSTVIGTIGVRKNVGSLRAGSRPTIEYGQSVCGLPRLSTPGVENEPVKFTIESTFGTPCANCAWCPCSPSAPS